MCLSQDRLYRLAPVIGLWPAPAAGALEKLLFSTRSRSVHAFADMIRARAVTGVTIPANINTPWDLSQLERHRGL